MGLKPFTVGAVCPRLLLGNAVQLVTKQAELGKDCSNDCIIQTKRFDIAAKGFF
jgi:hypothetical protein